jgi:hypothetical protein
MPPPPEILVAHAQEKFDVRGQLTDEETRARLRERPGGLDAALRARARHVAGGTTLSHMRRACQAP